MENNKFDLVGGWSASSFQENGMKGYTLIDPQGNSTQVVWNNNQLVNPKDQKMVDLPDDIKNDLIQKMQQNQIEETNERKQKEQIAGTATPNVDTMTPNSNQNLNNQSAKITNDNLISPFKKIKEIFNGVGEIVDFNSESFVVDYHNEGIKFLNYAYSVSDKNILNIKFVNHEIKNKKKFDIIKDSLKQYIKTGDKKYLKPVNENSSTKFSLLLKNTNNIKKMITDYINSIEENEDSDIDEISIYDSINASLNPKIQIKSNEKDFNKIIQKHYDTIRKSRIKKYLTGISDSNVLIQLKKSIKNNDINKFIKDNSFILLADSESTIVELEKELIKKRNPKTLSYKESKFFKKLAQAITDAEEGQIEKINEENTESDLNPFTPLKKDEVDEAKTEGLAQEEIEKTDDMESPEESKVDSSNEFLGLLIQEIENEYFETGNDDKAYEFIKKVREIQESGIVDESAIKDIAKFIFEVIVDKSEKPEMEIDEEAPIEEEPKMEKPIDEPESKPETIDSDENEIDTAEAPEFPLEEEGE